MVFGAAKSRTEMVNQVNAAVSILRLRQPIEPRAVGEGKSDGIRLAAWGVEPVNGRERLRVLQRETGRGDGRPPQRDKTRSFGSDAQHRLQTKDVSGAAVRGDGVVIGSTSDDG